MDGFGSLAIFIGLNFAAALSGALFKPDEWYRALRKPWFQPPDWLFAPAWTILYCMIAAAGWLVWREAGWGAAGILALYVANLLLNAGWSAVFFGLRRPDWAFAELIALWASTALLIVVMWPQHQLSAMLLLPYLAWVTFAGALNLAVWRLNPVGSRTQDGSRGAA